MTITLSANSPYSDTTTPVFRSATDNLQSAGTDGPAATVEISTEARKASSGGLGQDLDSLRRPLNIIWGNGPK